MFRFFRNRRRRRLRQTPLPERWWAMIDRNVPMVRAMSRDDRDRLGGIVRVLLDEKTFEGCAGMEVTDEVRLTIAAQAGVLLLHREGDYYPTLKTILVYPSAYLANHKQALPDGTVLESEQVRLGESWHRGALVLAWDAYHRVALQLLTCVDRGQITGVVTATSIATCWYVATVHHTVDPRPLFTVLEETFTFAPMTRTALRVALEAPAKYRL